MAPISSKVHPRQSFMSSKSTSSLYLWESCSRFRSTRRFPGMTSAPTGSHGRSPAPRLHGACTNLARRSQSTSSGILNKTTPRLRRRRGIDLKWFSAQMPLEPLPLLMQPPPDLPQLRPIQCCHPNNLLLLWLQLARMLGRERERGAGSLTRRSHRPVHRTREIHRSVEVARWGWSVDGEMDAIAPTRGMWLQERERSSRVERASMFSVYD
ncbi:hypothetical protein E2562_004836 [Oryza meyeriana var. granulata]|uniref:Uncharacterized protein n=1 Tax=Oryza meyeriana var. granulata TaxID=110450 RepID=A0A6G1DE33_9ORYZ|nr:hypothetical protein E2562_004836 [Oryza meyeriana var. granulata]